MKNTHTERPRIVYYVAQSLDGYIADAAHSLDWLFAFDHAEGVKASYEAFLAGIGALVMGARTYDFVLGQKDIPWPYAQKTWVYANRARPVPEGADVAFLSGEIETSFDEVARSAGGGAIWLVGGGELAAQYARAGLLDALHVSVVPVVLGSGVPLLPARIRGTLRLEATTTLGEGLVELRYVLEDTARSGALVS